MKDREYKKKDLSPSDCYIASYIQRFRFIGQDDTNTNKRCDAWENTILIRASDPDQAYKKAVIEAKLNCKPYTNSLGKRVQFTFEGLTSLLPIYDELEDGVEVSWTVHENKAIKTVKNMVKKKSELEVLCEK